MIKKLVRQPENQKNSSTRVDQLDGLRGLAIILVVLNHLRLTPLFGLFPAGTTVILQAFISSGKVSVSILFLLSGFLMATLYPTIKNTMSFYQKRYTRIFPAFLGMCASLGIIRFFWANLAWWQMILIILLVVSGTGLFWRWLQKLPQRASLGKKIFLGFFLFQLIAALSYIFILPMVPPAVFYQIWPAGSRALVSFLGNATMTLPFGNYLPQLDGVYWSILTEISLYLLYPIFFLPIVSFLKNRNAQWLNVAALLLCFPFFYGLSVLFKSVLGLGMLNFQLAIYFAFGVVLGFFQDAAIIKKIQFISQKIPSPILWSLCLFAVIGSPITESFLYFGFPIDSVLWAIPVGLMMIVTLGKPNSWTKFLSHSTLIRFGQFSFALYLTHTIAIEMFAKKGDPQTLLQMLQVGIPALIVAGILSLVLNYFLEQPYLKNKIPKTVEEKKLAPVRLALPKPYFILRQLALALISLLLIIWIGFHVPTRITTQVTNVQLKNLPAINLITKQPLILPFTATHQNLGMLLFDLRPASDKELANFGQKKGGNADQSLIITLYDDQHHQIATNTFPLYQISETRFFSTGLPIIPNSQGKKYFIELHLTSDDVVQKIVLLNSNRTFREVYFIDKADLKKNPKLILDLLVEKIFTPFTEPEVIGIFALCLPLLLCLALGFQPSAIEDIRHRR